MTIGFIGQGFIGKSYADDFEKRGYKVVRYSLEAPYKINKHLIATCDIVFIAVPTPTTPRGFDLGAVRSALRLVGKGKTAIIKSTILPGSTATLQKQFPRLFVMHSPEFLVLKNAAHDAAHPSRNIIGIPKPTAAFQRRARTVMKLLPRAKFELICGAREAEMVKYAGNFFLYLRVLYANLLYEMTEAIGADYEVVRAAVAADARIGSSHFQVLHDSGHKGAKRGRGAGGVCFIKDVAALAEFYSRTTKNRAGTKIFTAAIQKNLELLIESKKDLDLVAGVHGRRVLRRAKK